MKNIEFSHDKFWTGSNMRRFYHFSMCQEVKIRFIVLLRAHNISLFTTNYLWNKIYIYIFLCWIIYDTRICCRCFFCSVVRVVLRLGPYGSVFDFGRLQGVFTSCVFILAAIFHFNMKHIQHDKRLDDWMKWRGGVLHRTSYIMTAVIQIDIIFFSMLAFVLFLSLLLLSAHCKRFWRYFFLSIISRISWMWPHLIRWIADEILFMKISHS